MASRGKITDLFDVPGIKDQYDEVMGFVRTYVKSVEEASAVRLKVEESKTIRERTQALNELADAVKKYQSATDKTIGSQQKLAEMAANVDKQNKSLADSQQKVNDTIKETVTTNKSAEDSYKDLLDLAVRNELAQKDLAQSKRDLTKEYKAGNIPLEEYISKQRDIKDSQTNLAAQGRELGTALRNFAKEAQNSSDSLDGMKARLAILQQAYAKMSEEVKKSDVGKQVAKEADALAKSVNDQQKKVGNFKDNVGRYAESLSDGFDLIRREIVRLQGQAKEFEFRGDMRGVEAAGRQISGLNDIIKVSLDNNKTYTQSIRGIANEYKGMVASGQFSKEFLEEFGKFVAQSKHQSDELTKSIKAIGSETRGLDLATGAISTMASVFETAAGASALFGKNNEEAEKTIQKLVAIQSVANGIREIAKQLTEKETIAGKAYAVVQGQIAILTTASTTATQKLSAALKLTGIGLLISLVGFLVTKMGSLFTETKKASDVQKEFAENIRDTNKAIQEQIDTIAQDYEPVLKNLKQQLDLAEKSGASQVKIFAIKKQIAKEEKALADDQLAAQIKRAEQENENYSNSITGLQAVGNAVDIYTEKITGQQEEITRLSKERLDLVRLGSDTEAKKLKEKIDAEQATLETYKGIYNDYKKVLYDKFDTESTLDNLSTEEAKYSADERRKLTLESTRIEAQAIIDKNNLILANEKSTQAERINAIKENLAEEITKAQAERDAVLGDPSKQGSSEIPIAVKKFNALKESLTDESNKNVEKINEEFRLRDLQAIATYKSKLLDIYAELNQQLAANEQLTLDDRLKAQDRFQKAQEEKANRDFRNQLHQAGISDEEIALLEQDRKYKVQHSKLTAEEIEDIQIDHETRMLKISSDGATSVNAVLISELEKQKKIRQDYIQDIEKIASGADLNNGKEFAQEIIALNNALREKRISREAYEIDRIKIENKYNAQSIANSIKSLQTQLQFIDKYNPAQFELDALHRLQAAKALLNRETNESDKKVLAERVERLQKEYDNAKEVTEQKKQLEADLLKAKKEFDDATLESDEQIKAKRIANLRDFLTTASSVLNNVFSTFSELQGIQYDRETAAIEAATAALEKKKQKETEVVEATITNEAEKQKALARINGNAAAAQAALDQKKRQAERKKAEFDKAANIANTITSTALAVVTTLGDKTIVPGFLRIPLALTIGALGAAQIARAIAAPLPTFFKGKNVDQKDDYEGPAVVDDEPHGRGGKPEKIIRANGKEEKGGWKPRITWLWKKDKVIPYGDDQPTRKIKQSIRRKSEPVPNTEVKKAPVEPKIVKLVNHRDINIPNPEVINQYAITAIHASNDRKANYTPVPAYDDSNVVKAISKMERNVTRTIRDKTELNMNVTEQGIAAMYQHGATMTKYITDQTNWD
jgi:hypothetical protein